MSTPDRPASTPENRDGSGLRDGKGRFRPGNVANPKGRPKDVHGIGELARSHAPEAIERLVVLSRGRGSAAVAACKELLDRGLGKAPQAIDLTARTDAAMAIGGAPDQARQRIEQLIADAENTKALPPRNDSGSIPEPSLESGSPLGQSPTESAESDDSGAALGVRFARDGKTSAPDDVDLADDPNDDGIGDDEVLPDGWIRTRRR